MTGKVWLFVLLGVFVSVQASIAAPTRSQVPAEKRIGSRADLNANEARIAAALAKGKLSSRPTENSLFVDGSANPELFFPWELFQQFILQAYLSPGADRARERWDPIRIKLGLPETFWSDMKGVAGDYIDSIEAQKRSAEGLRKGKPESPSPEDLQENDCRFRHESMVAGRQKFGPKFDQFLYDAVAPETVLMGDSLSAEDSHLEWIEEGCP